ncbi:hypothetical protein CEXT_221511, partial [Caerostris extrusa]
STPLKLKKRAKDTLESKREESRQNFLVIITGVFVICWLPFFVMALLMSLCVSCDHPHPAVLPVPVARIPQLHPQPPHLHPLQPRLQGRPSPGVIWASTTLQELDPPLGSNLCYRWI